jgi:hypothetical protein
MYMYIDVYVYIVYVSDLWVEPSFLKSYLHFDNPEVKRNTKKLP